MTIDEVIFALEKTVEAQKLIYRDMLLNDADTSTKGGYFRVGDIAITISEIQELK